MSEPFESYVDRQIREAQQRGEFRDLPSAGKRLDFLDQAPEDNWWAKKTVRREGLDSSALLPPQIALRREAERLPELVLAERTERAVRERVEDFNERVRQCWRRPVEGPVVPVRTLDPEPLVARWREHRAELDAQRAAAIRAAEEALSASRPGRENWVRRLLRRG